LKLLLGILTVVNEECKFISGHITFNGLGMWLGNLSRLSMAETRSISAENFDGLVLRMFWDGEEDPSVEVPLGEFFL
jgi:hypothetical protein